MSGLSRRTFLWMTGGSGLALASEPSRKMINKLIPQVVPPEHIKPGEWTSFATTCRECPAGCGLHLLHRDGRVTKAEGNPNHPVNRGALCPRGQAGLQGLYDPERLRHVLHHGHSGKSEIRSWDQALGAISGRLASGGRAVLISRLETGTLAMVLESFAGRFGDGPPLMYEPFSHSSLSAAHERLFGSRSIPRYDLARCSLILSFGADFLESWISPVEFAVDYGAMHAYDERRKGGAGRYVHIGPRLSMTAANADRFVQVAPDDLPQVALLMVKIIIDRGWGRNEAGPLAGAVARRLGGAPPVTGISARELEELAHAFAAAPASVALSGATGARTPAAEDTAAAVALLNYCVGRNGQTVDFSTSHALSSAAADAHMQRVLQSLSSRDVLFIHNANPLYTLPESREWISRAGMTVYLGTQPDETAAVADWVLPVDYPLEGWGDYEPWSGIHGLLQPVMGRLYDTRCVGDIFITLASMAGKPLFPELAPTPAGTFKDLLRRRWLELSSGSSFETFWAEALATGGIWKGKRPGRQPEPVFSREWFHSPQQTAGDLQLWLWPSVMLHDGRHANRGWLQEAPDPVTFRVWGNWIDLHPVRAHSLGIRDGDAVEIATLSGKVVAPVRLTREVHEGAVALGYGQGHWELGRSARGVGVNGFLLQGTVQRSGMFGPCSIRKLAAHEGEGAIDSGGSRDQFNRLILRWTSPGPAGEEHQGEPEMSLPLPEGYRAGRDMYPPRRYLQHRWAMVIDLDRCIGCGACSVACYAENNIPVIGKERVARGREMAWLRVPPYRKPGSDTIAWLPMLCQHCDSAPCEPVCPVYAAVHNEEGLNAQVYNRCIGTRYCSNNCPYKVRRFNWINTRWQAPLDLQLNPEVTVRSRGVMEKCTFCLQRIRQAEHRAAGERRRVRDGEVQPACAQTCPTRVFTFGDLLDPDSRVTRLTRGDPRRYQVLGELNTKPAVTYLKRVTRTD